MSRALVAALATIVSLAVLAGCTAAVGQEQVGRKQVGQEQVGRKQVGQAQRPRAAATAARPRPDIVLVLMDDFSMDLLQTMKGARAMRRKGATYDHHYVVDSLCCVSRASLLTGQYPHQTGVRTNTSAASAGSGPMGGWKAFEAYGNLQRSVNVRLQSAGYTTGFVGKFLNEYEYLPGVKPLPPVPPGWSQFNVLFGSAYDGWGFDSTTIEGGRVQVRHHPTPSSTSSAATRDASYAGEVVEDYALDFIREHRDDAAPYFLEVAPYAPHNRTNPEGAWPGEPVFPAALRDRSVAGSASGGGNCGDVSCASLTTADLPGFGDRRRDNVPRLRNGRKARAWNTVRTLSAGTAVTHLRDRARMVQSIDRTLRKILKAVDDDTYVVLTSDNGFHLGQLGMGMGKGTAYDTDVRVPLLVTGPGVTRGRRAEMTSNIDLAPTFEELAGLAPARYRSGTSLVPTFADRRRTRGHVFIEHTTDTAGDDPDKAFTGGELKRIPTYLAVRSRTGLLVRHDLDPEPGSVRLGYEFYSYRRTPWERKNVFHQERYADEVAALMAKLKAFDRCTGVQRDTAVPARCRSLTR